MAGGDWRTCGTADGDPHRDTLLASPWESAFRFSGPLGTVPAYHLPLEFRLVLVDPSRYGGLGIAVLAPTLDRWFPSPIEARILTPVYGLLAVIACIGLLFSTFITGLIQLGGD
jgi:hypothetical protein